MVIFEHERRLVQDNALALSTLDVDTSAMLSPEEMRPAAEKLLRRLMVFLRSERAFLCITDEYRSVLPPVQCGFRPELLAQLQHSGTAQTICELAYRRGGIATIRQLRTSSVRSRGRDISEELRAALAGHDMDSFTAVSLQTHEKNIGVIAFPHDPKRTFGSGELRVLLALTMQIGTTLNNYILMHETQRRTKEYELLTQIGQVVSSRLDPDEVLHAIHKELGRLLDTRNFYIAFLHGDELRFEFQVKNGEVQAKRTRKIGLGLAEYIIEKGEPMLIRSDVAAARERLGLHRSSRAANSFVGVPIFKNDRAIGVIGASNFEREFAYEQRDVELLQTAAGQVAVAMENARLFAEEQRRSHYLEFLNNISKTAISNQNAEEMLAEIVREIQTTFRFDHIGIGILDYATKEIEIKAEAGTTSKTLGKRIPLGVGILGRVARMNELALVQNTGEGHLLGILQESRSVLCLPLTYGETLLGILNVESRRESAFAEQEVLLMRTLADLLATALHNAFVFQKMQQQSITDGLTGVKTRRFFLEAVQSEWKRASRSGRPFSVVLIDLDKFKEVNDSMGHLEGDLVLARVGRLLEQKCRQSNVVARYGGDEFVILMPETGADQAQTLSERLRLWIATDPMLNERNVSGSFGVASFPLHGSAVEDVIRVADAGMYVSKHAGGNRVSTATESKEGENQLLQRQHVAAYIEGFLQREETGPELAEELIATLKKMCDSMEKPASAEVLMDAIRALNRAAEARESSSGSHGETVSKYAKLIGRELGMAPDELAELSFAAQVHDVGKILLPERVLSKPGLLSEDEYYLIKMHTLVGAQIMETVPSTTSSLAHAVKYHHERFDGTGYPDGLKGEQIPLGARIIGLCDAYSNMVMEHPFQPMRDKMDAVRELEAKSGLQFDGMLVRILAAHLKGEAAAAAAPGD
jgi:diguanylate cyclase (GGDEF)-like protein